MMINLSDIKDKRIAVLLSGGVDSSVVLYELVRQGLQPDCYYIKIGPEEDAEWDCSSEEDLEMATAVSHKYGCRLEVVDCHREYWDEVTRYTMDKVRSGMTPNPDVMCNRLIKFGAFDKKCGHNYDLIATGHYAQKEWEPTPDPSRKPTPDPSQREGGMASNRRDSLCRQDVTSENNSSIPDSAIINTSTNNSISETLNTNIQAPLPSGGDGGRLWLCTSPDPVKDQTDFLAQLYGWQLEKALFPIGHMMKDEVRAIADREHLAPAHRRDSQGICFLGKIDYNEYLRRYLGELSGDVVELETGRVVGHHRGHWFHTIGQRKGLGLGGGPWFVVKKDIVQNIIYVSHGYDPATAYRQHFPIHDFHSINGQLPPCTVGTGPVGAVTLKIRHTPEFLPATLERTSDGCYMVHAAAPIHGVAPGQFCVIYDADHHRCYGSGEITVAEGLGL